MSSPDDTSPPGSGLEGAVSPSQAIIEAVAAREGVDPTEIEPPAYEPLYSVINPEALDSLFRDAAAHSSPRSRSRETQTDAPPAASSQTGTRTLGRVELEYEGYLITVYSNGQVELEESTSSDSA